MRRLVDPRSSLFGPRLAADVYRDEHRRLGAGSLRQAILDANATPGPTRSRSTFRARASTRSLPLTPLPAIVDPVDDRRLHAAGREREHGSRRDERRAPDRDRRHRAGRGGTGLNIAARSRRPSAASSSTGGGRASTHGPTGSVLWSRATSSEPTRRALAALPNAIGHPVLHRRRALTIGGPEPADRNFIPETASGSRPRQRRVSIQGNLIGTDATGTVALANADTGIVCASFGGPTTIGGSARRGQRHLRQRRGIWISQGSAINVVQGNQIGTNAAGTGPLGNVDGVFTDRQPATTASSAGLDPAKQTSSPTTGPQAYSSRATADPTTRSGQLDPRQRRARASTSATRRPHGQRRRGRRRGPEQSAEFPDHPVRRAPRPAGRGQYAHRGSSTAPRRRPSTSTSTRIRPAPTSRASSSRARPSSGTSPVTTDVTGDRDDRRHAAGRRPRPAPASR